MPSQKSPGTDGLPAEFYTMFWDTLGRDLIRDSYEYIFENQFPIAMISLDQEKAFDCLNWQFLDRVTGPF